MEKEDMINEIREEVGNITVFSDALHNEVIFLDNIVKKDMTPLELGFNLGKLRQNVSEYSRRIEESCQNIEEQIE